MDMEGPQQLERELNERMNDAMGELRTHLFFRITKKFYQCSAKCFDDHKTMQRVENCVQQCHAPVEAMEQVLSNEVSRFQEKIQRSIMACKDKFDEQVDVHYRSEDELIREAQDCVEKAVRHQIDHGIPRVISRIKSTITD